MELESGATLVMIPAGDLERLKKTQQDILDVLNEIKAAGAKNSNAVPTNYITAIEFMEAVRIRRSKFDELVAGNKIKTVKKKRKIYVPVAEIERYFNDPSID